MIADFLDLTNLPPLTKPSPRAVPYYGDWNQGAAEGEEEYYSDEDFDLEEALEQLEATYEDRESYICATCLRRCHVAE